MSKAPSLAESMKGLKDSGAFEPSQFRARTREGKKRLLVPVTPGLHKRLKRLALENDTTLEAVSRAALETYVSQQESK